MDTATVALIRKVGVDPQHIRRAGGTVYAIAPGGVWIRCTPKKSKHHKGF